MRRRLLEVILAGFILMAGHAHAGASDRPNVVLIVCDDLNDYVTGIPGETGHPQAITPNVEDFAGSAVAFRRAYCNNPICAPSRSSFLTGIYPHTSGNLFFSKWYENPVLRNSRTIMEHFRANGYHVAGSGKVMHHLKRNVWSEFKHKADYGPFVYDGEKRVSHPSVPLPFGDIGAVDGSFARLDDVPFTDDGNTESGWIYGTWGKIKPFEFVDENDRDLTPDERNASWAVKRIKRFAAEEDGSPFFLGVGFIRPHTPLHVPGKYFDMFPLKSLNMPVIKAGDAEDCHLAGVFPSRSKGLRYFRTLKASYPDTETGIKHFLQAYLASVAAVDECIGRVIDAVDSSRLSKNTIIVLTSDHGWQMGQKDYLFKNSPWEEATRVPLIIRAPGVTKPGAVAEHPVSLIDLYPTLVDLCGLDGDTRKNNKGAPLDGHSLRPFLRRPKSDKWEGPDGALSMVFAGLKGDDRWDPDEQHWSIRTRRWRYIRYNNGAEELYDHKNDPHEWNNLAETPEYSAISEALHEKMLEIRADRR